MTLATQSNKQGGSQGNKTPASISYLLWSPTDATTGQTQPGGCPDRSDPWGKEQDEQG